MAVIVTNDSRCEVRFGQKRRTQAEHSESADPPIADMTADILFCREGP